MSCNRYSLARPERRVVVNVSLLTRTRTKSLDRMRASVARIQTALTAIQKSETFSSTAMYSILVPTFRLDYKLEEVRRFLKNLVCASL